MITLSNWREKMSEDMRLRDFRARTQEAYLLAVRQFLDKVKSEPETLTNEDVRGYFLFLREERKMAPSTINIAVHGLRFFFIHTLHRDWPVFDLLRVNNPRKLPVVLGRDEVKAILSKIRYPVRRMALTTIYALGLRLNEGLHLQSGHIDGGRQLVWVRDGKGAKDRAVPLPRPLLDRLRHYWKHERPPVHRRLSSFRAQAGSWTTRHFRKRSRRRERTPNAKNTHQFTPCVTATPLICLKTASRCGRFSMCLVTSRCARRASTCT